MTSDPVDDLLHLRQHARLTLLLDSLAQPATALLGTLWQQVARSDTQRALLICLEHEPSLFGPVGKHCAVIDALCGSKYNARQQPCDALEALLSALQQQLQHPLLVFIDGITNFTYQYGQKTLFKLLRAILASDTATRIVLVHHVDLPSPTEQRTDIVALLQSPSMCASILRVALHPLALLQHLLDDLHLAPESEQVYALLQTHLARGWGSGFSYATEEPHASEENSTADGLGERRLARCILSYDARGLSSAERAGKVKEERGVVALLRKSEGDAASYQTAALSEVLIARSRREVKTASIAAADKDGLPADLTFSLSLTDAQRQARDSVPLPFARDSTEQGRIIYEPDSGDDLDEDEPDEGMEI
ncbi:uncharacterized protein L969DRAFT_15712 [Mixia osmundae IAM 14324]|uniref:Elongator complex protein 5 n=1 Tax=Mixia osmundae (strain CBS 9802 / IAM 14324 / JCM 22182 / KY 12970) TaxID=764103 RepID=G7DTR6_MIXOS|nr:uncharacterized protein L969DRAFT_15712 [Mixia osmundae IAM 14324]KEI41692.1 hypothetical protein L969DRAFT_15712 [Mixia osmundae IAM 14324]GAA93976.1 hypothetical protein E5Q_00623 [Mixia osmundae IAM 14324]